MKKTLLGFLVVASVAAIPAQAQLFRPSVVNGALLGGVAGAIIGNNSGHGGHTGEGAAIGVVAGALLGAAIDNSRQPAYAVPVPSAPAPTVYYQPAAPVVYAPPPPATVVYTYEQPVYCPPAPQVVYVSRGYCPPPARVVYYNYAPPRPVVYIGNGGGWDHHGNGGGRGRRH